MLVQQIKNIPEAQAASASRAPVPCHRGALVLWQWWQYAESI